MNIALILVYGCEPLPRLNSDLSKLNYSTTHATTNTNVDYDVAFVIINKNFTEDNLNTLKQKIGAKPIVFVNCYTNLPVLSKIKSKAIIDSEYTVKELEMAIELAKLEAQIEIQITKNQNISSKPTSNSIAGQIASGLLHSSKHTTSSSSTSTTNNYSILSPIDIPKNIIEQANIGIVIIKNHKIVYANPYIKNKLEFKSNKIADLSFSQFVHINERNATLNRYINRLNGKDEPNSYESTLQKTNGQLFPAEINASLFNHNDETVTLVSIRDLSLKKENERIVKESEDNFRGFFNNANNAIFILDITGVVLDVNNEGQEILQYSKQEIIGTTIGKFVDDENNTSRSQSLTQYIRLAFQDQNQSIEIELVNKNKVKIPVEFTLSKGKYFGLDIAIATAHNLSRLKNYEKAIIDIEEKYHELTNILSLGLFRILTNGEIVYSNSTFAQMLNLKNPNLLIGNNISEYTDNSFTSETIQNSNTSQDKFSIKTSIHSNNNTNIWVNIYIQPIFSPEGNLIFFDCIVENMSDRKIASDVLIANEKRLNAIISAIPDQVYTINSNLELIKFKLSDNENYPKFDSSLLGKSITKIFPADCIKKITEAINTKQTQEIYYTTTKNEQKKSFELRISPIIDGSFIMIQRDITLRMQSTERMEMLAQIIENTKESVSISNPNGTIIYVNPAFCKTYGFYQNEIIGKNSSVLRTPDFNPQISIDINLQTLENGWQGEIINLRQDGSIFPVQLSTLTIFDDNKKPKFKVGIARDISDQKRTERELIRAKERAEESNRLKTTFLANLSHEVRSPMNAVLGFIQLLRVNENLSDAGIRYIEQVQESGKQLLSLIEDIIDISKIQTNQIKLNIVPVNLYSLLNDLYTDYSNRVDPNKITFNKPKADDESQLTIKSDYTRIRQVFSMLLSNAIKFTSKGSIDFGYTPIIDDYSPKIQFFVRDTGIGISSEKQMVIFDLFRQGDDSFTRSFGGSGLGLTIAKSLVEMLGGNIWVESKPNSGTTFFFTIPYSFNNKKIEVEHMQTILLIEKSEDIKFYFDELSPHIEARILLATNTSEALHLFVHDGNVKVVIIDTQILDNDNYSIINDLKQTKSSVRIIAQTQIATQDELCMSTISGCDDYIVKSRDVNPLLTKIREYLNE